MVVPQLRIDVGGSGAVPYLLTYLGLWLGLEGLYSEILFFL